MNDGLAAPATRANNRVARLIKEAARLFRRKGYEATSIRDIVARLDMTPSSFYYHYKSKEDVLLAIYERGIAEITQAVEAAVVRHSEPWIRLEAACAAHLEALLESSDYPQVVVRILPQDVPKAAKRMIELRDQYEARFARLIADLKLAKGVQAHYFRLVLLAALNTTQNWFKRDGESAKQIAHHIVQLLRTSSEAPR
jgi:AcrR family transcriptional regulator